MTTETLWILFGLCAIGILFAISLVQDLTRRIDNLERRSRYDYRDKREVSLNGKGS